MNLSRQRLRYKGRASSALVVVLFAVMLATVIILAIMTGAQFERETSFYYEERIRADALAQSGLEQAIGLLRTGMGSSAQSWVSGPGRMMTITYGTTGQSYVTNDLSSDSWSPANTNLTGNYTPPNLNSQKLDGTYPIDGDGSSLPVRWIYVYQDGTLSQADTPTTSAANPLIGRYAFWVDNSSSRINLNTAWSRAATNTSLSMADISRINLAAVTNTPGGTLFHADDAHNISSTNSFNSDYDLRTNDSYLDSSSNRFAYTFYNHNSDGLNPFGQPKIYLTTQVANLPSGFTNVPGYTNYFFSILANNASGNYPTNYVDPGMVTNLSDANVSRVVNNLYSYLTNTTWPEDPGTSFASKYWPVSGGGANPDPRIFQLAVNIVEYVRAKESRQEIVNAIKGNVSSGVFTSLTYKNGTSTGGSNGLDGNELPGPLPILGVTRTPIIDEFGICWYTAPPENYSLQMMVELYLPPGCGITSLAPGDFELFCNYMCDNNTSQTWDNNSGILPGSANTWGVGAAGGQGSYNPMSGPYCPSNHFSATVPLSATNRYGVVITGFNNNVATVGSGYYNTKRTNNFSGFAAICPYDPNTAAPSDRYGISSCLPPGTGGMAGNGILGKQLGLFTLYPTNNGPLPYSFQLVDDPLTGGVTNNWQYLPSTWGYKNATAFTGGSPPSSYSASPPQQDTDGSGNIATNGWRMPYPYNFPCTNYSSSGITVTTNNLVGRMESLSELGYVSTGGMGMNNYTGAASGANGVPWRTLRLQPANSATLPDWALLDLFALPPASTNFVYQPYAYTATSLTNGGAAGGRLNVNGQLYPFTNVVRATPLMALLSGATNPVVGDTNYMTTNAGALATNVLNFSNPSLSGLAAKGQLYDSTNGFIAHVGELAELAGMADTGESSEGNLFEPLAQTTVSGNVFTVYTIGQALKQTPSGGIVINGEKRYQATIERIPTVTASATGTGLFRTVVVRELTP